MKDLEKIELYCELMFEILKEKLKDEKILFKDLTGLILMIKHKTENLKFEKKRKKNLKNLKKNLKNIDFI